MATVIGAEAKDILSAPNCRKWICRWWAEAVASLGCWNIRSISVADVRLAALFTSSASGQAKQEPVRDSLIVECIAVIPAELIYRGSLISLLGGIILIRVIWQMQSNLSRTS